MAQSTTWKYRTGQLTVFLAVVLVIGWASSLATTIGILVPFQTTQVFCVSSNQAIFIKAEHFRSTLAHQVPQFVRIPGAHGYREFLNADATIQFPLAFMGLAYGSSHTGSGIETSFVIIPYWPIIVTLIALSVWLLLIKIRREQSPPSL